MSRISINFKIGKFMSLYKAILLPDIFNNKFSLMNHVHSYERSSVLFYLPYCPLPFETEGNLTYSNIFFPSLF